MTYGTQPVPRLRCGAWALALAAVVALARPAAASDWSRFESANFALTTQSSPALARAELKQLELLRWLAIRYLGSPNATGNDPGRFEIIQMGSAHELQAQFSGLDRLVYGVYSHCTAGAVAYAVRDQLVREGISLGEMVLQHEYVHHLMYSRISGAYPGWFVEGFAEMLSQTYLDDSRLVFGAFNHWRTSSLNRVSPQELLTWNSLPSSEQGRGPDYYAQGWLLTHLLLDNPAHAQKLPGYFARLARGEAAVPAFEAEFGLSMDQLDVTLRQYQHTMKESRIDLKELPDMPVQQVPLPADAASYLVDESRLRTCVSQDKVLGPALLKRLRAAAARPQASYEARRAAAHAELLVGSPEASLQSLQALEEQHEDDAELHYLRARALLAQAASPAAAANPTAQTEARTQARAALFQAYRLRKQHAPTLYQLALLLTQQNGLADRNGLNAARGARALLPSVPEYAVLAMQTELAAGQRDAAVRALRALQINPHHPAQAQKVRLAIAAIERGDGQTEVMALLNDQDSAPKPPPDKPAAPPAAP